MGECRRGMGADLDGSRGCLALLGSDIWHDAAAVVALRVLQADEGVDGVAEEGHVRQAPQETDLHAEECLQIQSRAGARLSMHSSSGGELLYTWCERRRIPNHGSQARPQSMGIVGARDRAQQESGY